MFNISLITSNTMPSVEELLDSRLSRALLSLNSDRISKYRCPLEELYHNWTFFIDNINVIYWSCFDNSLVNKLQYLNANTLALLGPSIEIFIKKFWLFLNNFLKLFHSSSVNDHSVIAFVRVMCSNDTIIKHSCKIKMLYICWIFLSKKKLSEKKWNENLFEQLNMPKKQLALNSLENMVQLVSTFNVNNLELPLISTIFMLKWTEAEMQQNNGDKHACHICHHPLSRIEQIFTTIFQMFLDDQSKSNEKNECNIANFTQLMLALLTEMEYFFTLINDGINLV